jgi:quinol monooxygenase YgiN
MIARHTEVNIKPGKLNEFKNLYEKEILPLLRHETGFLDSITLAPENSTDRTVTISLWRTRQDCDSYHKKDFPKVLDLLRPFLTDTPKISYFTVEHTTFRKIESIAA